MKKAILITLILSLLLYGCNDSGASQSAESDGSSHSTNEADETAATKDGSNISVTFSDGKAVAKTQAYLGPYLEGKNKVTQKKYQQLTEGCSLSDAETILSKGTETMRQIRSGEESVTYLWRNSDGSGISIIFKDGKAADLNDMMLD